MAAIFGILAGVCGLASLVFWIMTLVKMFNDETDGGVGKGIFGIICGLYAFIWGWQTQQKYDRKNFMMGWTGVVVLSMIINGISTALMAGSA